MAVEGQLVGHLPFAGQHQLAEGVFGFLATGFGGEDGVLDIGVDHRVVLIILNRVQDGRGGRDPRVLGGGAQDGRTHAGAGGQAVFAAVVGELAVQGVQGQGDVLDRTPLQRRGHAQALLIRTPHRQAIAAREDELTCRRLQLVGGAQIDDIFGPRDLGAGAIGVVALLLGLALGIGHRDQDAELVVPVLAEHRRAARLEVLGRGVGAALQRQGALGPRIVERLGGVEADRAGHAALVLLGRERFAHLDLGEQLGGEDVEVERPVARGLASAVHRRVDIAQHFHAVQLHAGEVGTQAPQADPAALAAFAVDGHARQALQRFRQVEVGELGHVLGDDRVDDDGAVLLGQARRAQRLAEALDDDLIDRVGVGIGGRGRRSNVGGLNRSGEQDRRENASGGAHHERLLDR